MKAGRELDALVAEKLMEYRANFFVDEDGELRDSQCDLVPHFSTDIDDAWQVMEKLRDRFHVTIIQATRQSGNGYWCEIDLGQDESIQEEADTAPLAICLAAAKLFGYGSNGSYDASSAEGEISKPMADEST